MPILMNKDKKTAISVILGKMGDGSESGGTGYRKEGEEQGPRSDSSTAKSGAVQKLMNSIEHRDPEGMRSALETFIELCIGDTDGDDGQ